MTPNRACRMARERAIREGRDIYVVTSADGIRILPRVDIPLTTKPCVGYRPSGESINLEELPCTQ